MNFVITKKGMRLLSDMLSGEHLIFTRGQAGTETSLQPEELLNVLGAKQDIQINQVLEKDDKKGLHLTLSNLGVQEEYIVKQIGIYARRDNSDEVLFFIGQDTFGERIPPISKGEVETDYEVYFQFSNTYTIDFQVLGDSFVKRNVLEKEFEKLRKPVFDDSGSLSHIRDFPGFLSYFKSGILWTDFLGALKTALSYVVHREMIVDNCTTKQADKVLSARQGSILRDQIERMGNVREITLPPSAWRGDSAPFTQEVSIDGVSEADMVMASAHIPKGADSTVKKAAECIDGIETGNGYVRFYCNKKKPSGDVVVLIRGV